MNLKISKEIENRICYIQNRLSSILGKEGLVIEDNFAMNQILYRGLEVITKDLEKYEDTGKFNTYIFSDLKGEVYENKEDSYKIPSIGENLDKLLGFICIKDLEQVFNSYLENGRIPDASSFKEKYYVIACLDSNEVTALDNIIKYLWSEFISEGERLASTGEVENIDFNYVCKNSEKFLNLIKSLGEFNEDIIPKDRYYRIMEEIKPILENEEAKKRATVNFKNDLENKGSNEICEENKKIEIKYDPTEVVMGFIKMKDLEMLFNSCLKEGLYPSILDLQNIGYSFTGCGLDVLQNMQYKISGLWHIFIEQIKIFISNNVKPENIDFKYVYVNSPKFVAMIQSISESVE
ncbi:hypothetical protein CM240_0387 [Clostridium bornimense]|uniref:Uncharacterized protein n=1 Tax=Clostridium bornimense TaxID=1216932 RepID=W6RVC6_9CLOT|nr:hypothetical protein [Clostridium bornimense]CDM67554.1 hypothetical protein CM240_0387 [Clostridium bornimense]